MATDYHVLRQVPRTEFGATGRPTDVYQVWFRVDTDPGEGHEDYVTVDSMRYTEDNVRALIEAKVATIKAVSAL